MPTEVNVKHLKINRLTEEQYATAVKNENELYLTPDNTDQEIADAISTHNSSASAHSTLFSGKQDTLATQTAYTAQGSATKVPQITTNTLGQVTAITEVTITQPTVNDATLTIQKNGTNVSTFTANASSNVTANITVPTTVAELSDASDYVQTSSLEEAATVAKTGSYNDLIDKPTIPQGTVTSVRVQATSPVVSSQNTEQTTALNTTISLADGYGDTKNPYGTKTANYVLAGPTSGNAATPSFRALDTADIPDLGSTYLKLSGGTMTGAPKFATGSLTQNQTPQYYLSMDAFASGGEVKWVSVANTRSGKDGDGNTITTTYATKSEATRVKFRDWSAS